MITLSTNFGDIVIELNFDDAPISSANFLQYCRDGFYNDTIFHRVIGNFMIQGGGFNKTMKQKQINKNTVSNHNNISNTETQQQQ